MSHTGARGPISSLETALRSHAFQTLTRCTAISTTATICNAGHILAACNSNIDAFLCGSRDTAGAACCTGISTDTSSAGGGTTSCRICGRCNSSTRSAATARGNNCTRTTTLLGRTFKACWTSAPQVVSRPHQGVTEHIAPAPLLGVLHAIVADVDPM